MAGPEVKQVASGEEGRAASALVMAFARDPIMRWAWPEPHDYLEHFRAMVSAFGGRAFEHDTAKRCGDFGGVSLWLPPGASVDGDAVVALFTETIDEPRRSEMLGILEQMDEYHPKDAHWYLAIIGVDPAQQGQGTGSILLDHTLRQVDEEGRVAYLESSNPANVSLYQRHGFEVVGEIQVGSSPVVHPMRRPARG